MTDRSVLHDTFVIERAYPATASRRNATVAYAIDPKRDLSPTPSTLIGHVAGVADRNQILSMA